MLDSEDNTLISTANDCTVRQWDHASGAAIAVYKFADPVSSVIYSKAYNMLFVASWDKMIRFVDVEQNKIIKSMVASKEAIKCIRLHENNIYVAGSDPIIRSFDLEKGTQKMYQGHTGMVYTIELLKMEDKNTSWMFSGSDDKSIIIWDAETGKLLEQLQSHENAVTSITFALNDLYTGSFDHHIICWDMNDLDERIQEKDDMRQADIDSRKVETYWRLADAKKGKKKVKKGVAKQKQMAAKKKSKGK